MVTFLSTTESNLTEMTEDFFFYYQCLDDDDQWKQWESEAAKLEVTVDYYVSEFILPQQ
jgi:hypothetical protein